MKFGRKIFCLVRHVCGDIESFLKILQMSLAMSFVKVPQYWRTYVAARGVHHRFTRFLVEIVYSLYQ